MTKIMTIPLSSWATMVGAASPIFTATHAVVMGSGYALSTVQPLLQGIPLSRLFSVYPQTQLPPLSSEDLLHLSERMAGETAQRALQDVLAYAEMPRMLDPEYILPLWEALLEDANAATNTHQTLRVQIIQFLKRLEELSHEVRELLDRLLELEGVDGGMTRAMLDRLTNPLSPRDLAALARRARADRLISFNNLPAAARVGITSKRITFLSLEDLLLLVAYFRQEAREGELAGISLRHRDWEASYDVDAEMLIIRSNASVVMPVVSKLIAVHLFSPESYPSKDDWLADDRPSSLYRGFRVRHLSADGEVREEWIGSRDAESFTPNVERDIHIVRGLSAEVTTEAAVHLRELQYGALPLTGEEIEEWRGVIQKFREAQESSNWLADVMRKITRRWVPERLYDFLLHRQGIETKLRWAPIGWREEDPIAWEGWGGDIIDYE